MRCRSTSRRLRSASFSSSTSASSSESEPEDDHHDRIESSDESDSYDVELVIVAERGRGGGGAGGDRRAAGEEVPFPSGGEVSGDEIRGDGDLGSRDFGGAGGDEGNTFIAGTAAAAVAGDGGCGGSTDLESICEQYKPDQSDGKPVVDHFCIRDSIRFQGRERVY